MPMVASAEPERASRGSASRLLLLELLSTDRTNQYRNELFPFLRAAAALYGIPVRSVAFGFDPSAQPDGRFVVGLDAGDSSRLAEVLVEFGPTHVLVNELPAPSVKALIEATCPEAVVVQSWDSDRWSRTRSLLEWLGADGVHGGPDPAESPFVVDAVEPDHACDLLNDLSRTIKPFVPVVGGAICLYRRSVARQPVFEGVDISAFQELRGCAFCTTPSTRYRYATRPVPLAPSPSRPGPSQNALRASVTRLVRLLADSPRRPLLGFELAAVATAWKGPAWGELAVSLRRGNDKVTLLVRDLHEWPGPRRPGEDRDLREGRCARAACLGQRR